MITPRLTAEDWQKVLADPGRKLSLAELTALELLHICARLTMLAKRQERQEFLAEEWNGTRHRLEKLLTAPRKEVPPGA